MNLARSANRSSETEPNSPPPPLPALKPRVETPGGVRQPETGPKNWVLRTPAKGSRTPGPGKPSLPGASPIRPKAPPGLPMRPCPGGLPAPGVRMGPPPPLPARDAMYANLGEYFKDYGLDVLRIYSLPKLCSISPTIKNS